MLKIGLIYGTDIGNTKDVGNTISAAIWNYGLAVKMLKVDRIKDRTLKSLDVIILGAPTYENGEPFDDWTALERRLSRMDLTDKTIALFGLGDQRLYPGSFLNSMGWLYRCVAGRGARVVGSWPVMGYNFNQSTAVTDDGRMFFGLAIDQHNQSSLTDFRIANWVACVMHDVERFSTNEELRA